MIFGTTEEEFSSWLRPSSAYKANGLVGEDTKLN